MSRWPAVFAVRSIALSLPLLSLVLCAVTAQQVSPEFLRGLQWRLIGPHRGGRVTAVAGIAGDRQTYYMGTPGGGVWKTANGGTTWIPIFDAARVASIGDLAVAPSNPNIIYVATGEQTVGNGVWKSTDAGATWLTIGFSDSPIIPSLLVDPHDANLVYVAVAGNYLPSNARGIFKSSDGGNTWRKVWFSDDRTSPMELDFDPDNSHTIVAAAMHLAPQPGEKPSEGVDTILLRSTDAGETWTLMGEQGLPPAHRMRTGLSIASGLGGKGIFALMAQ